MNWVVQIYVLTDFYLFFNCREKYDKISYYVYGFVYLSF